jgi:phosphatidylserine/phosphatidylglycerophosphate/cardiolipin synthase-like enzyme
LLLPGPLSDHPGVRHIGSRYYERLLRDGVRIFEYQPRFNHSKVLLCDDWLSIGSSNADRWNYRWNLEANQELRDGAVIERVRQLFKEDFSYCTEFDYQHWRVRPRFRRLLEWFWGKVVAILAWFSDLKKYRGGPRDQ